MNTDSLFAGDGMPQPCRPAVVLIRLDFFFREEDLKWRSAMLGPVEGVAQRHGFPGHAYGCEGSRCIKRGMESSLAVANESETPGTMFDLQ